MATPPDQPRIGWAKSEAQNLLREEEIFTPAVPIDDILEQYATIATFCAPNRSTFCFEHHSMWHVHLNLTQTPGELHYSEAQALGHLKLHHLDYNLDALTHTQLELLNYEANCFADCITMPAAWVIAACPHDRINRASADTLAGLFSVSRAAIINRLHDLGLYAPMDRHDWRQPYCRENCPLPPCCPPTGANEQNDPSHH